MLEANATSDAHAALAVEAAAAAVVLLKNEPLDGSERRPLPLQPGDTVALVGSACVARQEADLATTAWDVGD
eukprot:4019055-Prymnesium_polylepis.1